MESGSDGDETDEDVLLLKETIATAQRVALVASVAVILYVSNEVIERGGNLNLHPLRYPRLILPPTVLHGWHVHVNQRPAPRHLGVFRRHICLIDIAAQKR